VTYKIRITKSNGEQTTHALDKPQTTIGADANANICIVGESNLLPQHMLLAPRPADCWVSSAPGSPVWDKDGAAVEGAYVPWGSRLTVGRCTFELLSDERAVKLSTTRNREPRSTDTASESDEPAKERIHPGLSMLLVITLVYAALQGLTGADAPAAHGLTAAPPLFDDALVVCRGENPGHRAVSLEEQAAAKSERSVFDLQDGIEAVALYSEAHACYRQSGLNAESEYVLASASALRSDLEEQYNLLRLRLSRDLAAAQHKSALSQVRRLSELLSHKAESNYGLALRRLSARLSKEGSTL
jgi:hypothetical protein